MDDKPKTTKDAALIWLQKKEELKQASNARAAVAKELKEVERTLREFLDAEEGNTVTVGGHTIGLHKTVKEQ